MNESESRAWDAHLARTIPVPATPQAVDLYAMAQEALRVLQALEVVLGDVRPDLHDFASQVTDAVSMVGRLTDQLDADAEQEVELDVGEESEEEEGHGWGMEPR